MVAWYPVRTRSPRTSEGDPVWPSISQLPWPVEQTLSMDRLSIERETTLCVLKTNLRGRKELLKAHGCPRRCFGLGRKQKRKCRLVTTHRLHCQQNRDAEQDGLSAFRGELGRRAFCVCEGTASTRPRFSYPVDCVRTRRASRTHQNQLPGRRAGFNLGQGFAR